MSHLSFTSPHCLHKVLNYDHLAPSYNSFALNIVLNVEPKSYEQVVKYSEWRNVMEA